jgi:hypothetical protein
LGWLKAEDLLNLLRKPFSEVAGALMIHFVLKVALMDLQMPTLVLAMLAHCCRRQVANLEIYYLIGGWSLVHLMAALVSFQVT